jgi:ubiquinone/menaquinone biosynthesis C-methylase UbiE
VAVRVTRGNGFLEGMLAKKRAAMANILIPNSLRMGRILDLGCGLSPYFLENTEFIEKYGVDRIYGTTEVYDNPEITIKDFDLSSGHRLPFDDNFFDVVSMLAVLEHLETAAIIHIIKEARRVLMQGGVLVGTTPVWWADNLLSIMAKLRLVSIEEIAEHKSYLTKDKLHSMLVEGGFKGGITVGSFEGGLNLWFIARY